MKTKQTHMGAGDEEEYQRPCSSRVNPFQRKNKKQKTEAKDSKLQVNLEDGSPWRNLQLILWLQNKDIDLPTKLEVAFKYVQLRTREGGDQSSHVLETVGISRTVIFFNNWIESVLISSVKKYSEKSCNGQFEIAGSCLDYRCWAILKFCLEESLKLNVSLSFSRDFLLVIKCFLMDTLTHLNLELIGAKESALSSERLKLQEIVLNCISLLFSSHGGVLNETLDLWIVVTGIVLELVQKVLENELDDSKAGIVILQFSCYLLEPFAKFLRVHPARKNGFHDFIDRLLEPLMHLLDKLHLYPCKNPGLGKNLLKLVEEVLSWGLFHPIHIDGFLGLQSKSKYKNSDVGKSKEKIIFIKSYHRHLFDKLEKIIACKKALPLGGIGELFHLFVNCVRKQKGVSSFIEDYRQLEDSTGHVSERSSCSSNRALQKYNYAGSVNSETWKPLLFDFFVQTMEYFLSHITTYIQAEWTEGTPLLDVLCVFRSANKLFTSFKQENIYIRMEDTSEGAYMNFLMFIYETIMLFSAKLKHIQSLPFGSNNGIQKDVLIETAKEVVVALHHLLDIEYKVVGDDLENLWGVMFTFAAFSQATVDMPDWHLLKLEIINLGCAVTDLYRELRQVNTSIFALCNAVRLLASPLRDSEACISQSFCSCSNTLSTLLCSPEFRLSIKNAIKSTPEGQASGCILQLTADISESLKWLNVTGSSDSDISRFDLKAELSGRFLAEVYTLVLDSMTVTAGNSNAVGSSINNLMALMHHSSSSRDILQPDIMDKFFSLVSGRTSSQGVGLENDSPSCWLLVFFFRVYVSCRSLYRQAISLVPPDTSRKMSETMGDSYAAYSGKDWLEAVVQNAEGYFSWIVQPSATLLTVIHNVSSIHLQQTLAVCPPLVYVLNAMTLQRLVDLNRMMKSFEYLLAKSDKLFETKMIDDTGVSLSHKRSRKWRKCLLNMKEEAAGLTKFMMSCFSSLVKDELSISQNNGLCMDEDNAWDLSIGALNEKTLRSAMWFIICQHVDIWCGHAAKRDLKKFLTHLIQCSLPFGNSGNNILRSQCINKLGRLQNVTRHQISLELLNDTGLYEQRFFRRYVASTFSQILEASFPSISADSEKGYLNSQPDWSEVIRALENSSNGVSNEKCVKNDQPLQIRPISQLVCRLHPDTCRMEQFSPSSKSKYAMCNSMLNLLSWMPKGFLSSKSVLLFATCILSLERVVVGSLLGWHNTFLSGGHDELIRLFLCCRRTFKSLVMASCEKKMDHSSLICFLSESSSPVLWLLKSLHAVIGFQNAFPEDIASQLEYVLVSLMDHTSYMFLTLGKYHFERAIRLCAMGSNQKRSSALVCEDIDLTVDELHLNLSKDNDSWRSLAVIAEILREHMRNLLTRFSDDYVSEKLGVSPEFQELKKLSPIISCIQGFLWGLASELDNIDVENCKIGVRLSKCKMEPLHKLNIFIDSCAEFCSRFLHLLLLEDDLFSQSLANAQKLDLPESGHVFLGKEESLDTVDTGANYALDEVSENCGPFDNTGSHDEKSKSDKCVLKGKFRPGNADVEYLLAKVQLFDQQRLNKTLLRGLLRGENSEVAYFLKHLFLATSAILRLKLKLGCTPLLQNLIPILIGISEVLLLEFASRVTVPPPFSFVWLDGVVKFLEELGNCFSSSNPVMSRKLYARLIDLHLRSIGKCIVLQGKKAALASKESESSRKRPNEWLNFFESSHSHETYCLDDFKSRLRMSFRVLVQKSSELHLLSAIQAIERAVVGVQEGCMTNYEIDAGSSDGGKASLTVAAGIDCLDSILEFVTGRKRVNVVKRHIQSLVACLFNVILHLQGPNIFCERFNTTEGYNGPDSGSVILMCIEVLRKVTAKHAFFQMDACHVGQSLNIPAALFQNFLQLKFSEALVQSPSISDTRDTPSLKGICGILDRQYSAELFDACCRLLCTLVKHYKSETSRCTALLEHSVSVLLHCLEMVSIGPVVRRDNFAWEVQEGVKCACCLRRVYEEIRQQKDYCGRHCSQFLSCYIWIYCGFGPLKTGIRREIDEALRPGVYALIDACSADDLQHLHTVFGEGPCRSTLAALQNDYKLYFQYEGKV